jgi:hypothetical protein
MLAMFPQLSHRSTLPQIRFDVDDVTSDDVTGNDVTGDDVTGDDNDDGDVQLASQK